MKVKLFHGEKMTKISWCRNPKTGLEGKSWNPIVGCSKVSEGCKNCYALNAANRMSKNPNRKVHDVYHDIVNDKKQWSGKLKFLSDRLFDPLKWKKPRFVFVNSMSDLFHEDIDFEVIDKIYAVMSLCPNHIFQILTKRPDIAFEYYKSRMNENSDYWKNMAIDMIKNFNGFLDSTGMLDSKLLKMGWHRTFEDQDHGFNVGLPLKNIWLGISVEDQKSCDERIPFLSNINVEKTFVSAEPLLSYVDFKFSSVIGNSVVDWMIVGGESGKNARPMHPDWVADVIRQCKSVNVPVFFKQWGAYEPYDFSRNEVNFDNDFMVDGYGKTYPVDKRLDCNAALMQKKVGMHVNQNYKGSALQEFPKVYFTIYDDSFSF